MDNFSKNHSKRPRSSVDGMLQPKLGVGPSARGSSPHNAGRPSMLLPARNKLDDFTAKEGFHASEQPLMKGSQAAVLGRQPRRGPNGVIDLSLPPAAAKPKKRRGWRSNSLRGVAGVLVVLILVGGFLFTKGFIKLHNIFKGSAVGAAALQDNVDPNKLRGEGDGRVNILLLGKGGAGHDGPDLTDTILIASIDPINKKAALLSVPRDLYTPYTSNTKINAVYADAKYSALAHKKSSADAEKAGITAIENQVQSDMGIPIHYYVMIDFSGFEQAINTVGGVDINVPAANTVYEAGLYDEITHKSYTLNVTAGPQHFDGQRALFYARSRETSARGDFDRTERQRLLLVALKQKVLSVGTLANPAKLSSLISAFGDHVSSDMSTSDALRLYDIGKTISNTNITSVGLADPPNNFVTTGNINGESIVRPTAGLADFSDIQSYVRNTLKDGFIANENASIEILNGTDMPGLATTEATVLKSYGYNVTTVADAPTKTYQKTILVDLTNGKKKYTKHYLEQRLGVTSVTSLPDSSISNPGHADFVIILGSQ